MQPGPVWVNSFRGEVKAPPLGLFPLLHVPCFLHFWLFYCSRQSNMSIHTFMHVWYRQWLHGTLINYACLLITYTLLHKLSEVFSQFTNYVWIYGFCSHYQVWVWLHDDTAGCTSTADRSHEGHPCPTPPPVEPSSRPQDVLSHPLTLEPPSQHVHCRHAHSQIKSSYWNEPESATTGQKKNSFSDGWHKCRHEIIKYLK